MSTISVPLTPQLVHRLKEISKDTGASRAAVMRKALERYAEERAVNAVLLAEHEYTLGKGMTGDLTDLAKRIDL